MSIASSKENLVIQRNTELEYSMNNDLYPCKPQSHSEKIVSDLTVHYGPMIGGADLFKALGYKNGQAFRQAQRKNRLGVRVFNVPSRQGKYALTADVAAWLAAVSLAQ